MGSEDDDAAGVFAGNAAADLARHGWFVGHFMGDGHPLQTGAVEVKWSVYQGGEARNGWGANRVATTLAVLVRGRFRLIFPGRDVLLQHEGDFVRWAPNVPHFWRAEGPAVVVAVRWPSLPGTVTESRSSGQEPGVNSQK